MAKKSSKHQPKPANTANFSNLAMEPASNNPSTKEPTPIAITETMPSLPKFPVLSSTTYKSIIDTVSIERLAGLAKDSPHDLALGIVWNYTYEEGYQKGQKDILQDLKKKLEERSREGEKEGMKKGRETYYGKGIVRGEYDEHERWKAAGHGQHCFTVAAYLEDSGTQTEPIWMTTNLTPPKPMLRNPLHSLPRHKHGHSLKMELACV